MVKIFISHSSKDHKLAEALADFLRSALRLKSDDIRCTSVDGYRLPGGAATDETLRLEVRESAVLIGLLSEASNDSYYVTCELGARWGAGKYLVPMLTSAANVKFTRGPIAGRNALCCDQQAHLHQLIKEVAEELGAQMDLEPPAVYHRYLCRVVEAAGSEPALPEPLPDPPQISSGSPSLWVLSGCWILLGAIESTALFSAITAERIFTATMLLFFCCLPGWGFYKISRSIIQRLRKKSPAIS